MEIKAAAAAGAATASSALAAVLLYVLVLTTGADPADPLVGSAAAGAAMLLVGGATWLAGWRTRSTTSVVSDGFDLAAQPAEVQQRVARMSAAVAPEAAAVAVAPPDDTNVAHTASEGQQEASMPDPDVHEGADPAAPDGPAEPDPDAGIEVVDERPPEWDDSTVADDLAVVSAAGGIGHDDDQAATEDLATRAERQYTEGTDVEAFEAAAAAYAGGTDTDGGVRP